MVVDELLVRCRHLLGASSSPHERQRANEWFMQFQTNPEAWKSCMAVLRDPRVVAVCSQELIFITFQLLRLQIDRYWTVYSVQARQDIQQGVIRYWQRSGPLNDAAQRMGMSLLSKLVVHSAGRWDGWKSDITTALKHNKTLLETMCMIPDDLQTICMRRKSEDAFCSKTVEYLQQESIHVLNLVCAIICSNTSTTEDLIVALKCLHNWMSREYFGQAQPFGIGILDINLATLQNLLKLLANSNADISGSSAAILAQGFEFDIKSMIASTLSEKNYPALESRARLVIYIATSLLQHDIGNNALKRKSHFAHSIAIVAFKLAEKHSDILWGSQWSHLDESQLKQNFARFLFQLSAISKLEIFQLSLEFWFFSATIHRSWGENSWENNVFITFMEPLIKLLIERCQYPDYYFDPSCMVNVEEIDILKILRHEAAETLLSICNDLYEIGAPIDGVQTVITWLLHSNDVKSAEAGLFAFYSVLEMVEEGKVQNFAGWDVIFHHLKCFPHNSKLIKTEISLLNKCIPCVKIVKSSTLLLFQILMGIISIDKISRPFACRVLRNLCLHSDTSVENEMRNLMLNQSFWIRESLHTVEAGFYLEAILITSRSSPIPDAFAITNQVLAPVIQSIDHHYRCKPANWSIIATNFHVLAQAVQGIKNSDVASKFASLLWSNVLNCMVDEVESDKDMRKQFLLLLHSLVDSSNSRSSDQLFTIFQTVENFYKKYDDDELPLNIILLYMRSLEITGPKNMQVVVSTISSVTRVMYNKVGIEISRPISELYDILRLQCVHGSGIFDTDSTIVSFFKFHSEILKICPRAYTNNIYDRTLYVLLIEISSVLLSIQCQDADIVYCLINYLTIAIEQYEYVGLSSTLQAIRCVAVPILQSAIWVLSMPYFPTTLNVSVIKFLFRIMHSKAVHNEVRNVFCESALQELFCSIEFIQALPCGVDQSKLLMNKLRTTRNKRDFLKFALSFSKFLKGRVSIEELGICTTATTSLW